MTKNLAIPDVAESAIPPIAKPQEVGGLPLPPDVAEYSNREKLIPYMEIAVELARASFPAISEIYFCLSVDPENSHVSVVLDVTNRGTVDEAFEGSRRFMRPWVERVPWPQADHIILSYHVA